MGRKGEGNGKMKERKMVKTDRRGERKGPKLERKKK
jgi:hypothetical protein